MKSYDSICCFCSKSDTNVKRVCWEITTDCNLKCPFCHRYNFSAKYYDISNLPQTITLLKEHQISNIIISGGEPMMHPSLFELLNALHVAGFELDLCTNGTLLNNELVIKLREQLNEISISIDSYEPTRHELMRQTSGCFEHTINSIHWLIASGFDVHTTTVVDASFVGHIMKMTSFLYQNHIKSVTYLGLIPVGTGINYLFTPKCQAELEKQINYARESYPSMAINTKQLLVSKSMCQCEAGNIVFGLGVDGLTLYPCLLTRKREGQPYGYTEGLCPGSKYLTQKKEIKNVE